MKNNKYIPYLLTCFCFLTFSCLNGSPNFSMEILGLDFVTSTQNLDPVPPVPESGDSSPAVPELIPDTIQPNISTVSLASVIDDLNPKDVTLVIEFDEDMDTSVSPRLYFEDIPSNSVATTAVPIGFIMPEFEWNPAPQTDGPDYKRRLRITFPQLPERSHLRWRLDPSTLIDEAGNSIDLSGSYTGDASSITPYASLKTLGEAYNTGLGLRDTGQIGCWDANGDPLGSGGACASYGHDASIIGQPSSNFLSSPTTVGGYPNDPITTDAGFARTYTSCLVGEVWNGTTCTGTPSTGVWTDAVYACLLLNEMNGNNGYAGMKGWRLPTIREIQSLQDFSRLGDRMYPQASFPSIIEDLDIWSSSTRPFRQSAYSINSSSGSMSTLSKTNTGGHYFCVRE